MDLTQGLLHRLFYSGGVGLALQLPHGLAHQEPGNLLVAPLIVGHRRGVVLQHPGHRLFHQGGVVHLLQAVVEFTADLHSMGQYIQQGERLMFETVVKFAPKGEFIIPDDPANVDGLNFLAGKSLVFVAEQAMRGTILAHVDGGVPNILLELPAIGEDTVGELIYFFEYVCGLSGYLLQVNPFDQPGVEAYKKNMFALLGKPGYEQLRESLEQRL